MSIESKLAKFGKFLDRSFQKAKESFFLLFLENSKKRKGNKSKITPASTTSPYAILIFDSFVAFISIFISIHLRIGMDFLDYSPSYIIKNMFVFGCIASAIFLWLQTHQPFWRYTSIEDMMPIFISVVLSNLLFFPLMMLMNQEDFLPYSVLIINAFVLTFMLLIPRFLTRIMYNNKVKRLKKFDILTKREEQYSDIPQIILVGNKESVESFLRDVIANEDVTFNFTPVGILSLNPDDVGRVIKSVEILGELKDISTILKILNKDGIFPRQLVITEKIISENVKKFLLKYVQERGLLLMHVFHQCTFNTISE